MQEPTTKHIVLVGFMGTGKSTVGRALADRLGYGYIDVDAEIVRRSGREIAAIFAKDGEDAFRELETAALADILAGPEPRIVATGGGAVLLPRNRELMLRGGFVVALTADPETIVARVKEDASRPLLQGDPRERVYKLLADRKDAYAFAPLTIDTTRLSVHEIAARIAEQYAEQNDNR